MTIYQFGISAGFNVATPTNIETINPGTGRNFYPPDVNPGYDPGLEEFKEDGNIFNRGFAMVPWRFRLMTKYQWYYIYHNILSDSRTGPVTVNTLYYPGQSYRRLNAIAILTKPSAAQRNFTQYVDIYLYLTRLKTPS